jgi:hypothetical protein
LSSRLFSTLNPVVSCESNWQRDLNFYGGNGGFRENYVSGVDFGPAHYWKRAGHKSMPSM